MNHINIKHLSLKRKIKRSGSEITRNNNFFVINVQQNLQVSPKFLKNLILKNVPKKRK